MNIVSDYQLAPLWLQNTQRLLLQDKSPARDCCKVFFRQIFYITYSNKYAYFSGKNMTIEAV